MPAVLFFEETGRAGQSLGALWMFAEIFYGFGGVFGAAYLVV